MPPNPKAQIERINQVSAMARTSWIALLGYLAFIGVTLLGVEDADFFVPSRQTQLPLVNVSIPTASFFVFAPILAAALYIYLHIILLKLWDAIADANRPRVGGHPLGDHLNPWLVNDWALTRKGAPYTPARPLLALGNAASFLLVWAAGPLVLAGFWWRSMPAHDERLTLLLAACLLLSLHTALTSWRTARAWLARPRREPPSRRWWRRPMAVALVLGAAVVSWLRTEGDADRLAGRLVDFGERLTGRQAFESSEQQEVWIANAKWIPKLGWWDVTDAAPIVGRWIDPSAPWNPFARTNLSEISMVDLPDGWLPRDAARTTYRETWCRREGLDLAVCGPLSDPIFGVAARQTRIERSAWCKRLEISLDSTCLKEFAALDQKFRFAWNAERRANIASLPHIDLSWRDLRRAYGRSVVLVGANMSGIRLEGADLVAAQLEGASLHFAWLEGASLSFAKLDGASFYGARARGADLNNAHLEGAQLDGADLESADLSELDMDGAILVGARARGANLRNAHLTGAILAGTLLAGADLRESQLEGALLFGAQLEGADLRGARGLTQGQLETAIGNRDTLLPTDASATDAPLYVWSCWSALLPEDLVAAESVCGPDNPRYKTGTPLPLGAPYPLGHPLAAR